MNVVIKINGREAIPVRALPFLSDRKTMSPDVVAGIFAGEGPLGRFVGLRSYRIDKGAVIPIAMRWWQTGPRDNLVALSSTIRAEENPSEHETEDEYVERHTRELSKWRNKSPGLLPAGAFVFKDEFEQIYSNEFKYGHYHFMGDDRKPLSELRHSERMALDYSPFVDDQTANLIIAGFESYITPDAVAANTHEQHLSEANTPQRVALVPPAPVVDANLNHTSNDQERRLTLLRELGGNAKYTHCEWKFTGIKALVDREKSDGRKRCDEKTIRADLKDAAQNERDSKAAGVFTGLGQR